MSNLKACSVVLLAMLIVVPMAGVTMCCLGGIAFFDTASSLPTSSPTATLHPPRNVEEVIRRTLGEGYGDAPRIERIRYTEDPLCIEVFWGINESLTEGLTKAGMWQDVADVADALVDSHYTVRRLTMEGSLPLVDIYGNTSEDIVIRVAFDDQTLYRANWDSMDIHDIYMIADELYLHPAVVW